MLGPDVDIEIHTSTRPIRVGPDRIIRMIRKEGGEALIGLVGVQSNQFPARRRSGAAVPRRRASRSCIGGFHVSGCISMLPEMPPEMKEAQALGHLAVRRRGRGGRLDEVLRDAWNGTLKPLYNHMDDLPALAGEPPILPRSIVKRTAGVALELRSRPRLPVPMLVLHHHQRAGPQEPVPLARRLEKIVRENVAQGIKRFFITDDNFARNRDWEAIFDRLIELREARDQDRLHHPGRHALPQDPRTSSRRRAAGVRGVHRAGEHQPRQPARGQEAPEQDHRIPQDAATWREHGAITYAGYILGFPGDTQGDRSCATSRSSSGSCRSTSSSSSS